jgi:hypothetical protein
MLKGVYTKGDILHFVLLALHEWHAYFYIRIRYNQILRNHQQFAFFVFLEEKVY